MTWKLSKALGPLAVVIAAAACGGCAVSAASILPSAGGAAPVAVRNLGTDGADTFWIARYEDVVQAALRAGERLSLELEEQEREDERTVLHFVDDRGAAITLHIQRRTETVTRVRFEIWSSVAAGFARLLGQQIIDELNDAGAFLVDWSIEEGNRTD